MNDAERKAAWLTVTDPLECLEELAYHSEYLGSDPYYRDLNDALWEMVQRVIHKEKERG